MLKQASITAVAAAILLAAASTPSNATASDTASAQFAGFAVPASVTANVACVRPGPNGEGCTDPRGKGKGKFKVKGPKRSSGQTARGPGSLKGHGKFQKDKCGKKNTTKECRDYILGNKKPPVREK